MAVNSYCESVAMLMHTTYAENAPSPIGAYVRAILFTLIIGLVGAIAFTVFQGSPHDARSAPAVATDSGGYADTANEPAAVDAQPIAN